MRAPFLATLAVAAVGAGLTAVPATQAMSAPSTEFVVLYGADADAARSAVQQLGGTVVRENTAVGVATVRTSNSRFLRAAGRAAALDGVTRNRPIGRTTDVGPARGDGVEREGRAEGRPAHAGPINHAAGQEGSDPLASLQWDMQMLNATPTGSYAVQAGDRRVTVGILDTGVDGSHPDIAPNFDNARSRNFTTDIPLVDGECADDPDGSCTDPANVDENGHGTHVASTIGSPINGIDMSGVAPNVTLVNIRSGQDSGYFFLQPSVDALTYAGDIGIDVVNMSYFIDPWLYNCPNDPTATPEEQLEQRTIIAATNRALDYAHKRNVVLVGAGGNEHTDLGAPTKVDTISPDFPPGTERERTVDNSCLDMPTEGNHVLSIYALGPSGRKADYSNFGLEQASVAEPGGWFRDGLGTPTFRTAGNEILAAYPLGVAQENGDIDENGEPTSEFVVKSCDGDTCAYYQWIQGTSMAAPHAVGVVALIVSEYGTKDGKNKGGLTLNPVQSEKILFATAAEHACPPGGVQSYVDVGRPPSFDATCEGTTEFNGFYGHGIVDALAAVTSRR